MNQTWVLVANASEARLYQYRKGGKFTLLDQFEHPESRQKGSELASDRPGHYKSSGTARGAYVPNSDPKKNETERFAHELAKRLGHGRRKNQFDDIMLVAEPHFNGLLTKSLDEQTRKRVISSIDKDYTKTTDRELPDVLGLRV